MLAAIIAQPDGSGRALLERAGVRISALRSSVEAALKNLPQVSGQSSQPQVSRELLKLLTQAEKDAEKRGDQYVAIEMFLLALTEGDGRQGGDAGRLLVQAGLTHKSLQAAVDAVRGGQAVESQDAEGQREALKKYTLDLTERARAGKLDPVIGRDDEIRRTIQILQRRGMRAHERHVLVVAVDADTPYPVGGQPQHVVDALAHVHTPEMRHRPVKEGIHGIRIGHIGGDHQRAGRIAGVRDTVPAPALCFWAIVCPAILIKPGFGPLHALQFL